jgi:membrane-associated phospholipid phosphatase
MLSNLLQIDQNVLVWLQTHTANGLFDAVLPFYRDKLFWLPAYLFLAAVLLLNFGRKGLLALLFVGATAGISDFTSSSIIKPLVHRARPCQTNDSRSSLQILVPCGNGYSFPSSHAANHFAIAVFIGILFRKKSWLRPLLLFWAATIGFAQMYVGVHYPLDVLCGAAWGSCIGYAMSRWYISLQTHNLTIL